MANQFEITKIVKRDITEEEIREREQWEREQWEREQAEQARIAALESARAKFRAFKLTEEEIDAVFSQATLS
ncbi:hypothetical protein [Flavobacterium sp.]|jgi:hypothetical protein|uniref:hypothetical protein n=1 Tax=Flavobacterium sp. TaxID=239 RepID=UPI0037BE8D6A